MFNYEYWGRGVFPSQINMALEEFLIRRIAEETKDKHLATVRFYSFAKDSIVLGYAQATDVLKKLDPSVDLTRRVTGGSHVQTGPNIIAYSFVVPRDGSFRDYEDMRAYFATQVANALSNIGVDAVDVDNKASTINVNGRVIASHAIWWGVKSALLHGLVHLTPYDVDKIASRVLLQRRKIGNSVYSEYDALRNLPTVSTELDGNAPPQTSPYALRGLVAEAILKEVTGGNYESRVINDAVIDRSMELLKQRYGVPRWINRHQPTFTRREVEEIPGEDLSGPLKRNLGYCLFLQVPDKDFKKMAGPQV
ncbi:MAG: lipoate--protein ligase family protein [Candidatus Aenigmarchaeota archaeon]|nr:lipoate--protein ligase family protein [Candidatus Aenigmarchaeota archaeon]